jgi:hypothetical protein
MTLARLALSERDDLLQRRDGEAATELLRAVTERLHGTQGLDLGKREVGREPALLRDAVDDRRAIAVRELGVLADVGRLADSRLVASDQVAVLGRREVGLDVVRTQRDGQPAALERVVGEVAACAAVPMTSGCGSRSGLGYAAAVAAIASSAPAPTRARIRLAGEKVMAGT